MDKKLIINDLMNYYKFKKYADFANFLDIKPQVLSNWISRNTFDFEIIYTKCVEINPDWLMTGKGEMLRQNETNVINEPSAVNEIDEKVVTELKKQNDLLRENYHLSKEMIDLQKEKIEVLQQKLQQCEEQKKSVGNNKSFP